MSNTFSSTLSNYGTGVAQNASSATNTQNLEAINSAAGQQAVALAQSNFQLSQKEALGDTIKNAGSALKDAAKAAQ